MPQADNNIRHPCFEEFALPATHTQSVPMGPGACSTISKIHISITILCMTRNMKSYEHNYTNSYVCG